MFPQRGKKTRCALTILPYYAHCLTYLAYWLSKERKKLPSSDSRVLDQSADASPENKIGLVAYISGIKLAWC